MVGVGLVKESRVKRALPDDGSLPVCARRDLQPDPGETEMAAVNFYPASQAFRREFDSSTNSFIIDFH